MAGRSMDWSKFPRSGLLVLAAAVLQVAALYGCSRSVRQAGTVPERSAGIKLEDPVTVEVSRAFVQANALHIQARVTAKTELPAEELAVVMRGLRDGVLIIEEIRFLSDVLAVNDGSMNFSNSALSEVSDPGEHPQALKLRTGKSVLIDFQTEAKESYE